MMRITKRKLKRIIQEEIQNKLTEGFLDGYSEEQKQRLDDTYSELFAFVIGDEKLFYALVDEHGWPDEIDTVDFDWMTFEDGFRHQGQRREGGDYEPYSKMGREYRRRKRGWG